MDREQKREKIITLLFSAALTVMAALFVLFRFGFTLESNDDMTLRNIASGVFTGNPDAHLIYIMVPLGYLWKGLYTVFPNISWYDLFMTGFRFLLIWILFYRVGSFFKNLIDRILVLAGLFLVLVVCELAYLPLVQYTELAGFSAAVSLLVLGTMEFKEKNKGDAILCIGLFLVTLWLRKQVFFVSLPFAALILLLKICGNKDTADERFNRFKSFLLPALIFVLLVGASFGLETIAYSGSEWKSFREFNSARTRVYDYDGLADYSLNQDFYESLEITEEEYTILREGDEALLETLDAKTLNAIADQAAANKKEWESYYSVPRKILRDTVDAVVDAAADPGVLILYIGAIALLVFFAVTDRRFSAILLLLSAGYYIAFVGLFTYLNRLPDRVFHGFVWMGLMFLAVLLLDDLGKNRKHYAPVFWKVTCGIAFLLVFVSFSYQTLKVTEEKVGERKAAAAEWAELNRFFKSNPESLYVLDNGVFATACAGMFETETTDASNMLMTNWTLSGPLEQEREARVLTAGISEALLDGNDVYFVQKAGESLDWLAAYFGKASVYDTVTLSDGSAYDIIEISR